MVSHKYCICWVVSQKVSIVSHKYCICWVVSQKHSWLIYPIDRWHHSAGVTKLHPFTNVFMTPPLASCFVVSLYKIQVEGSLLCDTSQVVSHNLEFCDHIYVMIFLTIIIDSNSLVPLILVVSHKAKFISILVSQNSSYWCHINGTPLLYQYQKS